MAHPEYPCLGARSVFRRDAATLVVLDDLADTSPGGIARHPRWGPGAVRRRGRPRGRPGVVRRVLPRAGAREEREFEALLWGALQHLHDHDDTPWAEGVAADPENPHFAFSVPGPPSSWSACTPTRLGWPAVPRCPRWCSTCTSSSSGCGRRPLPADARHHPPSGHRPAGLPQPDGQRPRRDLRGPAVRRPRRARRLDPTVRGRRGGRCSRTVSGCRASLTTAAPTPAEHR